MSLRSIAATFACCLAFTALIFPTHAADETKIRSIVDAAIAPLMKEHDVPGMAVAVTADGRSFVFNYGVASRESKAPVTDATLFETGSVSKPFAATLIGYALALGKVSLDERPGAFMPQLKGHAIDKASLLNLATYTAGGLPLQFPASVTNDKTMLAYLQSWKPDAAPGAQRRYSNPSIGLAGHLAALAMKRDFAETMERDLFPKLGLTRSFIRVPQSAAADYAFGYGSANKPVRMQAAPLAFEAYGVKTTAADLIRFVEANIDPSRLEPSVRRAVEGTQFGYFKVGPMVQGLGWEQYSWPVTLERLMAGNARTMAFDPHPASALAAPQTPSTPTLFNKTGSTGGFATYVAFVPAKKIGIVMLMNRAIPIPPRLTAAHAILEKLAN